MMDIKIDPHKVAEKFFGSTPALKDYTKAYRLYGEYQKLLKNPKIKATAKEKKLQETKIAVQDAYDGISRLFKIYNNARESMDKVDKTILYSETERNTFFEHLREINADITLKYNEFFKNGVG